MLTATRNNTPVNLPTQSPHNQITVTRFKATLAPERLWRLAHIFGWLLVALIIYGSLTTSPLGQDLNVGDKSQHFLAYFITMAWFAQIHGHSRRLLIQGLFLIALAVALEWLQMAGDHRSYEPLDMLAGAAGVLLAAAMPKTLLDGLLRTTGVIG